MSILLTYLLHLAHRLKNTRVIYPIYPAWASIIVTSYMLSSATFISYINGDLQSVIFPAGKPWSCIFCNWSRFGSYNVYLYDTQISYTLLWLSSIDNECKCQILLSLCVWPDIFVCGTHYRRLCVWSCIKYLVECSYKYK